MKKSAVRIVCFVILLILVLYYTNHVFKVKYGEGIYDLKKFYELEDNTVDVLILGSSHAFEAFNTGVLWNEYGMASFVLGGAFQPMWSSYYYLKEALKTQTPQLILLEGYTTMLSTDFINDGVMIKNSYGLKWSKDKIEAIKVSAPKDRWKEFLLEYSQYHTRYTELSKADFLKNQGNPLYRDWKGFGCNMETIPLEAMDVTNVTARGKLYDKTEKYYRMTLELAREHNIPIVVMISPYAGIDEEDQAMFNTAEDIAKEYSVPFINYNLRISDIGIDFSTDVADPSHLNYRGNQKYSYVVGTYLKQNFVITDHRGDPKYQTWQNQADYISAMIENQLLVESVDQSEIVGRLFNPNYCLLISLDGTCRFDDAKLYYFFTAMGIATNKDGNGIYYRDNSDGTFWYIVTEEAGQYFKLDAHDFCVRRSYDETNAAYTNQIIVDNTEYKKVVNGVNVIVYDKMTQNVVDSFGLDGDNEYCVVR